MSKVEGKQVNGVYTLIIHGDGAKWGVSDWYEEVRAAIAECLTKGASFKWTTDWYGVKKEIQSARITCHGDGKIIVEASTSDDFDTEGNGEVEFPFTGDIDVLEDALDKASDEASEDRKDNAQYIGFSLMRRADGKGRRRGWMCQDYYIMPDGSYGWDDPVPGDNCSEWGLQSPEIVPDHVRARVRLVAERFLAGKYRRGWAPVCPGWKIKPWEG